MHLPYKEIRQRGERRYSTQLMERLRGTSLTEDEQEEVIRSLCAVSDPRTLPTLRELLFDTKQPDDLRERAGRVLRNLDEGPEEDDEAQVRRWWASDDKIVQAHALRSMERLCPDIIEVVAKDDSHPLQFDALIAMQHYFSTPTHQKIKIAALAHHSPKIRDCAAYILLWDEPIRAEDALLQASHDEDTDVVIQVCKTLEYYPTQRVMRRLLTLRDHPTREIAEEAASSLESLRGGCLYALKNKKHKVREHIRGWLSPLWELLGFTQEELSPDEEFSEPKPPALHSGEALPLARLRELLGDPDQSIQTLRDHLHPNRWAEYPHEERGEVRRLLAESADLFIRRFAPAMSHAWGEQEALLASLRDPDFLLRKTATYYLGKTPPYRPEIAQRLWEYFEQAKTWSVHASETLVAYIKHASKEELRPRLLRLARDREQRENIRHHAVDALKEMQARAEVLELSYLLTEEPPVTWALHIALLDAFVELGLPAPDIAHLFMVDNLDLQIALAPFSTTPATG